MYRPRNQYYLRISKRICLPLYLYLDDRHLDWFSDPILQHVLSDLQPRVLNKLQMETDANLGTLGLAATKKGTVDTHRGETYQFCYFFRKLESHAVLQKTRHFTAAVPAPKSTKPAGKGTKRKTAPGGTARKKQKTREKSTTQTRRSARNRKIVAEGYNDQEGGDQESEGSGSEYETILSLTDSDESDAMDVDEDDPIRLEVEEEEAKPKPVLHLKYRAFDIPDRCLCVVVEPWPPVRSSTRDPSVAPPFRASSVRRGLSATPSQQRGKTPLFLPDEEEEEEQGTSLAPPPRRLPPVPLFGEDPALQDSEDEDGGGMLQFSQVLQSMGDTGGGAAELDEETEDVAGLYGEDDLPR